MPKDKRGWWLALVVTALLAAALPSRAAQAAAPLPADEYWALVAETRTVLGGLEDFTLTERQGVLEPLASRWEAVTQVALAKGVTVPVDHRYLVAQLRAADPDLSGLEAHLAALVEAQAAWAAPRHDREALASLAEVLARPEFTWPEQPPSPLADWWAQLHDAVLRWLNQVLPGGGTLTLSGDLLGYLFTGLSLVVLAAILAYIFRGLVGDMVAEAELPPEAGVGEQALTAARALQQAQEHSNAGDHRTAVRYLYLSSLLLLMERGLLPPDRSLTNREQLRRVADRPELAQPLREVVEVFDRVWYGYQPLDAAAYQRYAAQVQALHQQK